MPKLKYIQRVCLADDDSDDSYLFAEAVKEVRESVSFSLAEDGDALMRMLHHTSPPPDILFLDLNMPRKNGLACLDEIRASQAYCDMPVVIFSTSDDEDLVQHAYEKGASLYVKKPNGYNALKQLVHHCLAESVNLLQPRSRQQFLVTAV